MKFKISETDFNKLDEGTQALYEKAGDKYQLKVEGMPDADKLISRISSLESSVSALETNNTNLKSEKDKLRNKLEDIETGKHRENNDVEALEKSWQAKYEKLEGQKNDEVTSLTGMVEKLTTGNAATTISSELAISGSSAVLLPHIERRLRTEIKDGEARTVVLDKNGNPSALSLDELKEEFKTDPGFKPLINGSNASGGGHQHHEGGQGSAAQKEMARSEFDTLPPAQQAAFSKEGGRLTDD